MLQLAIEIDGSSYDHPVIAVSDLEQQNEIEKAGVKFLRFKDYEVRENHDSVIEVIE